jgi:hypothetical protein
LNPDKVISGERPQFGEMIELDLGGFGIRDLAPSGNGFLIIAGARDGTKNFRLYNWDGKGATTVVPGVRFEHLNPEAIFQFPTDAPDVFQILSDDGSKRTAGQECKELPKDQRHFRAGELRVPLASR